MKLQKSEIIVWAVILCSFIISIFFAPHMPEQMASHWNAQGQVDGYLAKFWGLSLLPSIMTGLTLLFIAIPRIDPLKANIEKFRAYYDGFVILFLLFLLSLHAHILLWNIGITVSPNVIFPIGLGLLFFYLGILCDHAKRNWFIGIRTPWTLSSEKVWEKTHDLGGKLFKIAGIIAIIGVFCLDYAFLFILVPVLVVAVYTIVYSYVEYQKET